MSLRKFVSACFLSLMFLVLTGKIIPFNAEANRVQASLVDLNTLMFNAWKEWDTLLTRWMDSNGTIVDLYDYSRKSNNDPSNKSLSGFGGYLLALVNMYEATNDNYYLSKLRVIVDSMISESWFYRNVWEGIGEIFYVPMWSYDDAERDSCPMATAWAAYAALKLYLWTNSASYLHLATRVASESLDKLTAVNNSTDLAWSASYYTCRNPGNATCVNRQAPFVPFYLLYGKTINSTFSNQITKMLHWQFKAQLGSGGIAYRIGESTGNHLYTAIQIAEYLSEYDEAPTFFSDYQTNIQNAIDWLIDGDYIFAYAETFGTIGALILADKEGFSIDASRMKPMVYMALKLLGHTQEGLHGGMNTWTFGWRWPQFSLGELFRGYPMTDGSFDEVPTKIIDWSGSGNTKSLIYKFKSRNMFCSFKVDSAWGNGAHVFVGGLPNPLWLFYGRQQGTPTSTITNGTYYLNVTHDFGSGNVIEQYYYGTDLIVDDITGSRDFQIFIEKGSPTIDVLVENGTIYEIETFFNSTRTLSNNFLIIQRTLKRAGLYIYSPSTTWEFEKRTGYAWMRTTISNGRVISASNLHAHFSPSPLIARLNAYKHYANDLLTETMPLSFTGLIESYKKVKEAYGTEKWGDADWKTTYNKCLSDPDVRLVMHDSPETNKITSWTLTSKKLDYMIRGETGTSSTTKIYCGSRGEPIAIYAVNGTLTWSYSASTAMLTLNVTHQSPVSPAKILAYWKFPGDVNDDGIVDVFDLALICKAYEATTSSPSWNEACDIDGDELIDKTDLSITEKNYGKIQP